MEFTFTNEINLLDIIGLVRLGHRAFGWGQLAQTPLCQPARIRSYAYLSVEHNRT